MAENPGAKHLPEEEGSSCPESARDGAGDGPGPPPGDSDEGCPQEVPLPVRVGSFRVVDVLGEGGMGIVYLAEQTEPVHRRVALKVVSTALRDRESLLRFAAERQALARLSHPNVAQMYEAGTTDDGRPYFAMELVDGVPISSYCDQRREPIRNRLRLFTAVCDGVQHAHQKGILHRDIKPSNVLVTARDGRPLPKIIDFGIAKAIDQPLVDEALLTGERVIGTPAYLPPEAIDGSLDVDTRSDVYSLGMLLYELLLGVRPFETRGDSFLELLQRIAAEEPSAPSTRWRSLDADTRESLARRRGLEPPTLRRKLLGDLDWIVLRAIAKDRRQRYGSPAELAADIGRYLRHEPVEARPPSTLYRVRKFVRRRRGVVAAMLLLVASLAAGVVARTIEARRTRLALEETRQVSQFLVDLFEVSDPGQARGETITARELLDRAADTMRSGFADQPLARARFMHTVGSIYTRLGLYAKAQPLLEEALEIRDASLADDHPDLAASLNDLGDLYWRQGRCDDAELLLDRCLAIRESELGTSHPAVATTLVSIADVYRDQARYEEAGAALERSLAMREKVYGADHADVAAALQALGALYWTQGRYQEAEGLLDRALRIWEKVLGPDHPDVAVALHNSATLYMSQGRYEDAEPLFERALAIWEKVLGRDHPSVADALQSLGILYRRQGRLDDAESLYRRALAISEETLGQDHPDVAAILTNLATLHLLRGRYDDAEPLYRRALEIRERRLGPEHPKVATTLGNLAALYGAEGNDEEAQRLYHRALAIKEQALGPTHPSLAFTLHALAENYQAQQRYDLAEPLLERALAIRERALPPDHPDLRDLVASYAALLRDTGRDELAAELETRFGSPKIGE